MSEALSIFRQIHHICIVVDDIERAEAFYESVGVGPWEDYPPLEQYTDLDVPDVAAFLAMKYRFAQLDNIQLQLCEPPQADCPQRRFLNEHGEGVFHLGFAVVDCDQAERDAEHAGLPLLMRGRRPDQSGFAYFDTAAGAGVVLEVRQSAVG